MARVRECGVRRAGRKIGEERASARTCRESKSDSRVSFRFAPSLKRVKADLVEDLLIGRFPHRFSDLLSDGEIFIDTLFRLQVRMDRLDASVRLRRLERDE
jgi:hypothetical protein